MRARTSSGSICHARPGVSAGKFGFATACRILRARAAGVVDSPDAHGPSCMSLAAGTRLGPYEILAPIGAGGMGEVYRARDERLRREVAVKVLPASLSTDADRLRRFEQEAQAAGTLNHPNITAVYDIGTHEGSLYVVSELL